MSVAQAPASPSEIQLDEAARLLFEAASLSYDAGDFEDALARYITAFEVSARPELLYNIALCHDRLEHKEEAATFYDRFVVEAPDSSRVAVARSRAEILRTSMVERNDEAPVSRSLAGPITSFAIAGAGLVTLAVAGLITRSRFSSAEETCVVACDQGELDGVNRTALIADIGLGIAAAGAVVGVIWLLVGRRGYKDGDESDAGNESARFTAVASPSAVGVELSGVF